MPMVFGKTSNFNQASILSGTARLSNKSDNVRTNFGFSKNFQLNQLKNERKEFDIKNNSVTSPSLEETFSHYKLHSENQISPLALDSIVEDKTFGLISPFYKKNVSRSIEDRSIDEQVKRQVYKEKLFKINNSYRLHASMFGVQKQIMDSLKPKMAVGDHLLNKMKAQQIIMSRRAKRNPQLSTYSKFDTQMHLS